MHAASCGQTTKIPLHRIVDQVVSSLLIDDPALYNLVTNDVSDHLNVGTDNDLLALILGSLISQALLFSGAGGLHITAKSFGAITLVHVRSNYFGNDKLLYARLQQIMPFAQKLGGCICISNNTSKGTTVVLSFFNAVVST